MRIMQSAGYKIGMDMKIKYSNSKNVSSKS